jgi:hypothetical protein
MTTPLIVVLVVAVIVLGTALVLSAARRKFRRVEGAAGGLTNVMAWDEWRQRSSSTPRFVVSSSVARPA